MNKFIISTYLLLFFGFNTIAQNKYVDVIKSRANLYATATKKHSFKDIVSLTYPKYVSLVNKDTLLSQVSKDMVDLQNVGLQYKSIIFAEPKQIHTSTDEIYCILPQKIIKNNSQGEIKINTYLFAISNNQGENWFFLTEDEFLKNKKVLFPLLDNKIELPKTSSKFIRNRNFSSFDKPN